MKAVVFDMDGVLFDTERLSTESWMRVAGKREIPGMEEVVTGCIGRNARDTREFVLEHLGQDFDYEGFMEEASVWFHERIEEDGVPLMEGVERILCYLTHNGYKVGLATSTRYESVMDCLKRAGLVDYFSVIVTGDMVEHSKPQPDIYLLACKKLGVDPAETYAVEDSYNGIRSAHAAGMKAVMIPDLLPPTEEMRELSCLICENLTEFMKYLNQ